MKIAGIVGLLVLPLTAGAAEPSAESIATRAAGAPLVVVGEPLRQESLWENGGIWTYTEMTVLRSIGDGASHTVLVRQRGGTVGSVGQRVSHVRLVEPQKPHLLFLWEDDEAGVWTPGASGVLPIDVGLDGLERVEGALLAPVLSLLQGAR